MCQLYLKKANKCFKQTFFKHWGVLKDDVYTSRSKSLHLLTGTSLFSCLFPRVQQSGWEPLSDLIWQWRQKAIYCQLSSGSPRTHLHFSRHMISHFYRLGAQCFLQGAVWERFMPLCLHLALFRPVNKGEALSALRGEQLMPLLVPRQSLPFARFQFLKENNEEPVPCSFWWPWCVHISKLAKQSASFIESVTLGAGNGDSVTCVIDAGALDLSPPISFIPA